MTVEEGGSDPDYSTVGGIEYEFAWTSGSPEYNFGERSPDDRSMLHTAPPPDCPKASGGGRRMDGSASINHIRRCSTYSSSAFPTSAVSDEHCLNGID
ncbi:hypothetical protein ABH922_000272 [Rhodococcus sp. 27YEA15]|uniref:hypothetical protein n=1 Tax=Rhodococcus sp. 27YEA15 TaxID=3156259 RepID=UPI003C7BE986